MPNSRQLALLIWLLVAMALMLRVSGLRSNFMAMLRIMAGRKALVALALMILWVTGELAVGRHLSLWAPSMATSTAFWFFGAGLILLVNSAHASEKEHFFRDSALASVRMSVFLGAFMNLFVLTLWAELLLQPFLVLVVMLQVVAGFKEEFRSVKKLVDFVLNGVLLTLAIYEVSSLIEHSRQLTHGGLVLQALLPVWLVIGLLPFVFAAGLWSQYETAFLRTEWSTGRNFGKRLALLTAFGPRSHALHSFIASSSFELMDVSTFVDARRVIRATRSAGAGTE